MNGYECACKLNMTTTGMVTIEESRIIDRYFKKQATKEELNWYKKFHSKPPIVVDGEAMIKLGEAMMKTGKEEVLEDIINKATIAQAHKEEEIIE